ncbi:uncharacterized protein PFL1_03175 [Pseudozyma flocculosa PF-1]|uniref:L-ornithine N(5)-monooxygenase [NAD(P)H] n=2 Tax=Pseudozyma flocculosa TaxID=84751 RepID=A0A5C3F0A4_9BASI|nr:uncharacterized protein PFL1_03175 [Pseudozyma flocculosa PF-1]EPQ29420.1 hypothetical protein PFL1_03175 [Pseudozyma flocculosa PF-1]SPO37943.1 related to L-ornithine 5-monooxygenase [Pseudozyma flocculosa]
MSTTPDEQMMVPRDDIYDLLGFGYGPAHLALSIALRENQDIQDAGFKSHFVEKRGHFAWHPALLLPGSQLQVSPLKDLATLRDPTSTYTFFNFLHSHGRLAKYINKDQGVPSRREWTAYLAWAAKRMDEAVTYGHEVVAVEPLTLVGQPDAKAEKLPVKVSSGKGGEAISLFRVTLRPSGGSDVTVRYARNISVAVGGIPRLPEPFQQPYAAQTPQADRAARIVHSGTYIPSLAPLEPVLRRSAARRAERMGGVTKDEGRLRLAVLGGGQSSTEMLMNLHDRFPTAIVTMILRASALVPSDDTGFINSVAFDPERTDEFWNASDKQRKAWLQEFKRTNYSVVRTDLLNELHDKMYDAFEVKLPEELQDPSEVEAGRMEIRRNTWVEEVALVDGGDDEEAGGVRLTVRDKVRNDRRETIQFDAVFLGTGFVRSPSAIPFLEPLRAHYPALSPDWAARDTSEDDDIATKVDVEDDEELERRRECARGITRDYRLVPYSKIRSSVDASSGKSTPFTSSSDTSSTSSQQTLASELDAAATTLMPEPSLYVLGGNEATHGLSDSLLSICAHRSGELTASLLERLPASRRMTGPSASANTSATTNSATTGSSAAVPGPHQRGAAAAAAATTTRKHVDEPTHSAATAEKLAAIDKLSISS